MGAPTTIASFVSSTSWGSTEVTGPFFGAPMMLLFYFGDWDMAPGPINGDFMYTLVFLTIAAFWAGRILGLDASVERYEVDERPLTERCPTLEYIPN